MTIIRWIGLISSIAFAATAHAGHCPTQMADTVNHLRPVWQASASTDFGISHLFGDRRADTSGYAYQSVCLNCHNRNPPAALSDVYRPCGSCHTRSPDVTGFPGQKAYPDWLDFRTKAALLRNSYYVPGNTKAEASLVRANDGTMPPGAAPSGLWPVGGSASGHGWCDEINTVYKQWIAAGFP